MCGSGNLQWRNAASRASVVKRIFYVVGIPVPEISTSKGICISHWNDLALALALALAAEIDQKLMAIGPLLTQFVVSHKTTEGETRPTDTNPKRKPREKEKLSLYFCLEVGRTRIQIPTLENQDRNGDRYRHSQQQLLQFLQLLQLLRAKPNKMDVVNAMKMNTTDKADLAPLPAKKSVVHYYVVLPDVGSRVAAEANSGSGGGDDSEANADLELKLVPIEEFLDSKSLEKLVRVPQANFA